MDSQNMWSSYLSQFILFRSLRAITKSYAEGIKDCLKKGIQYFFIPEDIFNFGKPLLANLIEFQTQHKISDASLKEADEFAVETEIKFS